MAGDRSDPRRHNLRTIQSPNLVLVEGPDEFEFIRFLRKRADLQIHAYEGKAQLRLEIKTLIAIEGFDQVRKALIVRDSDADPSAALASVLDQLAAAIDSKPPKGVRPGSWFPDPSGRLWCVWLMPGPDDRGDLETLLWQAVAKSDHTECIDSLIGCLENCSPVPFGAQSKARLYSWLATQRDPIKYLDWALSERSKLFDPGHVVFQSFANALDAI